jgi:hypothetical protein
MKLKAGIPLVTKTPQQFSNAVVYKVIEGVHRTVVYVLTDFGNLRKFPSEEDMFEDYVISDSYLDTVSMADEFNMGQEWLDGQFDIRDRLQHQIELLIEALEGK